MKIRPPPARSNLLSMKTPPLPSSSEPLSMKTPPPFSSSELPFIDISAKGNTEENNLNDTMSVKTPPLPSSSVPLSMKTPPPFSSSELPFIDISAKGNTEENNLNDTISVKTPPLPSSSEALSMKTPPPFSSSELPFIDISAKGNTEENNFNDTMSVKTPPLPSSSEPLSMKTPPPFSSSELPFIDISAKGNTEENNFNDTMSVDTPPPPSSPEILSIDSPSRPSSPELPCVNASIKEILEEKTPIKSPSHHTSIHIPTIQKQDTDDKPGKEELYRLISKDLDYLNKVSEKFETYIDRVKAQVESASTKFKNIENIGEENELHELKAAVAKLKLKVLWNYKIDAKEKDHHRNKKSDGATKGKEEIPPKVLQKMPQLYKANTFENSWEFQDFMARLGGLSIEQKLCLFCFSVFPEDAIIKKRLMVYWWIGEGFVPPIKRTGEGSRNPKKTAEEYGNEFFDKLMELGFIEPVNERGSLVVGSCRMHPFMRHAVVALAERAKFFDFDLEGNPMVKSSSSYRSCLVREDSTKIEDWKNLHMLFNVNEDFLPLTAKRLSKMISINVLYLGRWQHLAEEYVRVEDTKLLDGLYNLRNLMFFSLRRITGITELPECISQLTRLTILDLRGCYNLEMLPEGIGLLTNLTHLDMSECYLLEHMPQNISLLSKLQVLKGFVVGDTKDEDSCTLDHLSKLTQLTKLSIYTVMNGFPDDKHVSALGKFPALLKLTIEWGRRASQRKPDSKPLVQKTNDAGDKKKDSELIPTGGEKKKDSGLVATGGVERALKHPTIPALPSKLEKLDLKCFPKRTADWLKPANLEGLKKLYIRGGKFFDLGQFQDLARKDKWAVEQLRLKYLTELEMDWRELQELFTDLFYLEKVECPKLSFFPCNASGVWMDKTKIKQKVKQL